MLSDMSGNLVAQAALHVAGMGVALRHRRRDTRASNVGFGRALPA